MGSLAASLARNSSAHQCWLWTQQHQAKVHMEQALLPHSSIQMLMPLKEKRSDQCCCFHFINFMQCTGTDMCGDKKQ